MNAQIQTPTPTTVAASEASLLAGVNVLLEGPTGVGKTHSLGTLVESGVETFYLGLEAGMESLLGYWTDRSLPIPANLRWHRLKATDYSWANMIRTATDINTYTNDALAKLTDTNKSRHNQFITLLTVLNDFEDQRTGQKFGPVDSWGPSRALIIDAMTGINAAAMSLVVGAKPIKSLVDWGIAMDQIERLIKKLTEDCRCHFVLISHVERETDQVLGGVKITVGTLGQKLAAKIPPMFSDVILAHRNGTEFLWSTINSMADLKTRNLALSDKIPPDFRKIMEKWKSRGGRFSPTVKA